MTGLYPSPPHLIVSVYREDSEIETFAGMHEIAVGLGCEPLGIIDVAHRGLDFERPAVLGSAKQEIKVTRDIYADLISGRDLTRRVLKAGLRHKKYGKVIIEALAKFGSEAHPIAISLSAHALGIPEFMWSAKDKSAAYSLAEWSRSLLEAGSSRCDVLYGGISVEIPLPTPWEIRTEKPMLASEIFISKRLMDRRQDVERQFREAFENGDSVAWKSGLFLSGWAPYNSRRLTIEGEDFPVDSILATLKLALA